jgi:glycosyltransferase involved in cell wall biosynthesis
MQQCPYRVSFIVPALNEEAVVESVVRQILQQVDGRFAGHEVILVDDGSSDATGAIMDRIAAERSDVRVIHNPHNLGFGSSFQCGLAEARFEYVMLLCGDGGLPASSLPPIFDRIGSTDIVIPWMQNLRQIKTGFRYALSRLYTALLNLMFGLDLHYYNGLPLHRRDLLQHIRITSSGFGFQAEILVKLIKSGCSYVQVGVLGAERTQRSTAMRARNWLSVGLTIAHLLVELVRFERVPADAIASRPRPVGAAAEANPQSGFPKH